MRDIDQATITKAFMDFCGPATDPRLRVVLDRLVHHLHAFTRETQLTHAEWRKGIELLTLAGRITDDKRNEFSLFSDILGLSSLVDMLNSPPGGTESSVLGPFHILDAPRRSYGADLKGDKLGDPVYVSGRVRDRKGRPIAGAEIDVWQTAANGLYSNQDLAMDPWDFRARFESDGDGRYAFSTVRPAPYTVPTDGPGGEILIATGRDPWRASHLHFVVQAPGFRTLVTEVFPADDPYLDSDAVFGVRRSLIVPYERHDDPAALSAGFARAPTVPFHTVGFEFILVEAEIA